MAAPLTDMPRKPSPIDDFLANVPAGQRKLLETVRRAIRRIVPDAEECISYRMPAFRWRGQIIAGFAPRKSGGSYYPFSGRTLAAVGVEGYRGTRSALHFDQPLPAALLRRLLRARMAEVRKRV